MLYYAQSTIEWELLLHVEFCKCIHEHFSTTDEYVRSNIILYNDDNS